MAPSFKDKQKWVVALEASLDELKRLNKKEQTEKCDEVQQYLVMIDNDSFIFSCIHINIP